MRSDKMRKTYTSETIYVSFEPARCIHAAECVKGLPQVFDTKKRLTLQMRQLIKSQKS